MLSIAGLLKFVPTIRCFVDNKYLCEKLCSTKHVNEQRLRMNIVILKEMLEKDEIQEVKWISTKPQLADSLRKGGKALYSLAEVFELGKISLSQ